jgi:methylenetetrahydrofolate--tRNA-(uracil-5-)-methyltransferase
MIPGLEHAEFLRYGSCHRNTFVNSPAALQQNLSLRTAPHVFLAGQICGNEGYVESMATGKLAALFAETFINGKELPSPPVNSAIGGLLRHVTQSAVHPFSPSSFHFGLLPPLESTPRRASKKERHTLLCERALGAMRVWAREVTE